MIKAFLMFLGFIFLVIIICAGIVALAIKYGYL